MKYNIIQFNNSYQEETFNLIFNILENEFDFHCRREDIEDIEKHYLNGKGNFWVAVANNKVIGSIGLMDANDNRGYLRRLAVVKEYREYGVASKLLLTLLDYAEKKEVEAIYLTTYHTMKSAVRFYDKHKFTRIEELPKDMDECGDDIFYRYDI